jgi:hypothetical protein
VVNVEPWELPARREDEWTRVEGGGIYKIASDGLVNGAEEEEQTYRQDRRDERKGRAKADSDTRHLLNINT